jgi:hypothetical protein
MNLVGWPIAAVFAGLSIGATCRADQPPPVVTAIKQGAQIDKDCLKLNVLKDVGACRHDATGIERPIPVMLGLYFHMWFADAVLSEVYRSKNSDVADKFEELADAEFPAVSEYETKLRVSAADLCVMVEVNCETAARYHERWQQRLKRKRNAR